MPTVIGEPGPFYVDTDGSNGWITMDDVSTSQTGADITGGMFFRQGQPLYQLGASSTGTGGANYYAFG